MKAPAPLVLVLVCWCIFLPITLVYWFYSQGNYLNLIITFLAGIVATLLYLSFCLIVRSSQLNKKQSKYNELINKKMEILAELQDESKQQGWIDVFKPNFGR